MVTLNLTLFVIAAMFLVFLWAMNLWVFRPLLKVMDARDDQFEDDRGKAESEAESAHALEREYASAVAVIHREASHTAYHAKRAAQEAHNQRVAELKKREERELAEVRDAAMKEVAEERRHYPELVAQLAGTLAGQMGLEGHGS